MNDNPEKRNKGWRANMASRKDKSSYNIEDEELLRIQGLVRCKLCLISYPFDFIKCPNELNHKI
mgnify:CR=1 FL=1